MTSKIEQENQARQAAEADRLNKKLEREGRDAKTSQAGRDAFSKLVKTSQESQSDAKAKGERAQGEAKQGEQAAKNAKQGSEAERVVRMARGGVMQESKALEQARSFQGVLSNQQGETREADRGRVERRDTGNKKDTVEKEDRGTAVQKQESKRDAEADLQRVEAREQGRPNAAISADSGGDQGEQRGGERSAAPASKVAGPKASQAAREVKQIPPELLEKLVSAVYLAVNDKGLKEFQIELKDGPLKGSLLKISADDGKIALSFSGLGADEKRLVEASKGELMRRLEKKGLSLSRLDVK